MMARCPLAPVSQRGRVAAVQDRTTFSDCRGLQAGARARGLVGGVKVVDIVRSRVTVPRTSGFSLIRC